MPKVLIVTYYWPPGSGAGVQRWLKFSKYLPSFGWEPVVLTVDPEYASYPAIDNTLEKDIPEGISVYKTKATDYFRFYKKDKSKIPAAGFANSDNQGFTAKVMRFVRGNFFIPDPRRGWNKYAFSKACEIIESEKITHVITTSPPHSTQLIGLKLKKRFPSIKWVADLRDPWTDIYYYSMFYHTWPAKAIDKHFEKEVLKKADRIITVGKSLKDIFSGKMAETEKKIHTITNGFDEEDFEGSAQSAVKDLIVSYIGTLSESYPVEGFLKAVSALKSKKDITIRLRFVGTISPSIRARIMSYTGETDVDFVNYVDHLTAVRFMRESSLLLLIIPDHSSSKSILTGKLFEYIASGRPVICLGPVDGDAADILSSSGFGKTFEYNDITAISEFISAFSQSGYQLSGKSKEKYTRRFLTGNLAGILNEL